MYIAQIRSKSGALLHQGHPYENREQAARFVFATGPQTSKLCSSSRAYRDAAGNWQSNGLDIQWHKRADVWREPAKPCDVGLFSDEADQLDLASLFRE